MYYVLTHASTAVTVLGKLLDNPFYTTFACDVCVSSIAWIYFIQLHLLQEQAKMNNYAYTMKLQRSVISHGVPQGSILGLPLFAHTSLTYPPAPGTAGTSCMLMTHLSSTAFHRLLRYWSTYKRTWMPFVCDNIGMPTNQTEASVTLNHTRERVSGQKIDVTVDNQTRTQGII